MLATFLKGVGVGAGLMYFYDPVSGRRRRSLLRDQVTASANRFQEFIDVGMRDLNNRVCGLQAELRSRLEDSGQVADDVLVQRVRATIGHHVTNPSAIEVEAHQGQVIVRGPVLASQVRNLIGAIWAVRGVRRVENQLEVHQQADVPALQGNSRGRAAMETRQSTWTPAGRLVGSAVGATLMLNCIARRTPTAILMGTAGFSLFVRALTNQRPIDLIAPVHGLPAPPPHQTSTVPSQ